ncbi:MAG TPA: hypothetical protein VJV78_11945 [Polyangiales bacterium]|nr:hypothetical protein [Polyangiales bacterium]
MPVTYRIDGNVVTIRAVGPHSTEELRAAWIASEADPACPKPAEKVRICVDSRDSESLATRSVAELRETANWFEQRAQASSRICAFVTRPGIQYGLARMMAAWIDYKGYTTFVTTDPAKAAAWLNDGVQPAIRTPR